MLQTNSLLEDGDKSLVKLSALTSLSYPVGFKEPLPDAIAHPFWDSDVLDPPNKMERKLLCLIMQLFKASRTPSIVSDPCFDETLTAEVQISKYLSLLVELHTRGFHSLQRGDRALCNQSLWAVGMVLRRISPLKKKELREQFPILKPPPSLRLFANVLRSASRFAQAWETGTSSAPFSRISHIDCDMLRTMCTLSLPDFYTLQKALLKLHENY
ncbi:hypothetical protein DSO57_1011593 [Entomophthora muscae]|uniref:Uncharacterized protein n=1 Tax=Entomophthora muscae TaxID=34485 RepID=A0ACC2TH01_9FUNG|nr:hypothetical protein DSO57_1011593 [Entomophthora muscae]